MQVAYTGKKISISFNVKDQSKFDHQHDVVYYADGPNEIYRENYIGESGRRISDRIKDHNVRDLKSLILKHSVESGHEYVSYYDFKVIAKNSVIILGNVKLLCHYQFKKKTYVKHTRQIDTFEII